MYVLFYLQVIISNVIRVILYNLLLAEGTSQDKLTTTCIIVMRIKINSDDMKEGTFQIVKNLIFTIKKIIHQEILSILSLKLSIKEL